MIAAGYLYWLALQFEFPQVPGRLGPDAWPKMVLGLLLLTCLVGLVKSFRRADSPTSEGAAAAERPVLPGDIVAEEDLGPSRYGLVAMGFALFLAYPVALEYLGFPIATFLLMVLFMVVGQWRNILGSPADQPARHARAVLHLPRHRLRVPAAGDRAVPTIHAVARAATADALRRRKQPCKTFSSTSARAS
jgi:hypothetical protein